MIRNTHLGTHVEKPAKWRIATGIFLLVLVIYALSSPGRIDIIDGQARFDVAYNWLHSGQPLITDTWIKSWLSVPGRNKLPYSYYGAPASVFSMPLMALGALYDGPSLSTSQFLFSLTSPILGALIAPVLFLFYVDLGVRMQPAFFWTMVTAFATLLWPSANSSFDNAQHAFFAIASVYLGFLSAKHSSKLLAIMGGLVAAVLILYQEYFMLVLPFLAIAVVSSTPRVRSPQDPESNREHRSHLPALGLHTAYRFARKSLRDLLQFSRERRASVVRYLLWSSTAIVFGLILSVLYNHFRFGSYFENGKLRFSLIRGYPILGNPIAGFATLLFSPGKSIFLYSPTIIVGFLRLRQLRKRQPQIAFVLVGASLTLVSFLSCITFAGGDWCWGPRYLVPLVPLWALAFPFVPSVNYVRRKVIIATVIGIGCMIQIGAISVENQRFFFEHKLRDFFWAEDPWFYFKHSALFSRIGETSSLVEGMPATATMFNPTGMTEWCTYTVLGPPPKVPRTVAPLWMRRYKVFYLPRPWPLWMQSVEPDLRPINIRAWILSLAGMGLLGILLIYPPIRELSVAEVPSCFRIGEEANVL